MNGITRRNFTLSSLAAATAAGFVPTALAQTQSPPPLPRRQTGELIVNTYGGAWERHWRNDLVPAFTRQTGIKPVIDIGVGKIFAANLRAAGIDNTPYSCTLMNENIAALLRDEGMFDAIPVDKVPNLADVYPNLRAPNDLGVIGLVSPIGIGYRTDLVKTKPRSWRDLWDNPEFKGKIGLYQIGAAGAHLFLLLAAKLYGGSQDNWEVALREIQKLQPFPQVDFSGALSQLLLRGDIVIAPIDASEIVGLKKRGVPVDIVMPPDGLLAFEVGWYMIKNAPAREEAYKFLNYILDPGTQQNFARAFSGVSPANSKAVIPSDVRADMAIAGDDTTRIIKWDWSRANKQLPEITEAWNRTIK